jgi:hypothetical protein
MRERQTATTGTTTVVGQEKQTASSQMQVMDGPRGSAVVGQQVRVSRKMETSLSTVAAWAGGDEAVR